MPLLYHWTRENHERDLAFGAGFHLNQGSARLHQVEVGDSLWAFTRRRDRRYGLAMELVVRAKTLNPRNFRYGHYRLWGDLERTRYFDLDHPRALVVDQVVRHLSVAPKSAVLGQAFQGHAAVRVLTQEDHQVLAALAADLPLDPRARVYPEEKLEALTLLGQADSVYRLVVDELPLLAAERQHYLYDGPAITRSRSLVRALRERYGGRCQLCLWEPSTLYGRELSEAHHMHWLSRGGDDAEDNLVLLCPNHHRAVHACDAPFDYRDLAFVFPDHREALRLNAHLTG